MLCSRLSGGVQLTMSWYKLKSEGEGIEMNTTMTSSSRKDMEKREWVMVWWMKGIEIGIGVRIGIWMRCTSCACSPPCNCACLSQLSALLWVANAQLRARHRAAGRSDCRFQEPGSINHVNETAYCCDDGIHDKALKLVLQDKR